MAPGRREGIERKKVSDDVGSVRAASTWAIYLLFPRYEFNFQISRDTGTDPYEHDEASFFR